MHRTQYVESTQHHVKIEIGDSDYNVSKQQRSPVGRKITPKHLFLQNNLNLTDKAGSDSSGWQQLKQNNLNLNVAKSKPSIQPQTEPMSPIYEEPKVTD